MIQIIKRATISGALNTLLVTTAFVVMVLSMRAIATGSWIEKETISGNQVTTIVTVNAGKDNEIQRGQEQLALGDSEFAGIGSCGTVGDACSIADLLANLPE